MEPASKGSTTKKSVSFHSVATARPSIHISNYSPEELEAAFYTRIDIVKFRKDAFRIAKIIDQGEQQGQNVCRRGVERFTRYGKALRGANHTRGHTAVFEEQLRFRRRFSYNLDDDTDNESDFSFLPTNDEIQEKIAAVYSAATLESASFSHFLGLEDETAAAMIRDDDSEDEKPTRKSSKRAAVLPPRPRTSLVSPRRSRSIDIGHIPSQLDFRSSFFLNDRKNKNKTVKRERWWQLSSSS